MTVMSADDVVALACRTRDRKVAGSTPHQALLSNSIGQIIHTRVPVSLAKQYTLVTD